MLTPSNFYDQLPNGNTRSWQTLNIESLHVHSHKVRFLNTLTFSFLNESYSDAFTDKGYLKKKVYGSYFFHNNIPLLNYCTNEYKVKEKPSN